MEIKVSYLFYIVDFTIITHNKALLLDLFYHNISVFRKGMVNQ